MISTLLFQLKREMTMKVTINNKEKETNARNVAQLAAELQLPEKGVAVAIDNKLAARTEWDSTPITEAASIVIIKAFCGG